MTYLRGCVAMKKNDDAPIILLETRLLSWQKQSKVVDAAAFCGDAGISSYDGATPSQQKIAASRDGVAPSRRKIVASCDAAIQSQHEIVASQEAKSEQRQHRFQRKNNSTDVVQEQSNVKQFFS